MKHVARPLTADEIIAAKAAPSYLKLTVELGPGLLGDEPYTKAQLAKILEDEATRHPKLFSSQIISHIAEHLRLSMELHKTHNEPARTTFTSGYSGCGSCDPGDGTENQGQVCYDDEGGSSCEVCA